MGVPPLGGFFSKSMVIAGAAEEHPYVTGVFVLGAVLTLVYLFRVYNLVFLGEPRGKTPHEGSPTMVYAVASLALLSLVSGIAIHWPGMLAETAVVQIMGLVK
jgi:NADH:ubiquinone oxidoreductase subunit 5 (subunit L)/multisubunit Na+/H+ antiporter MnhA subunit